MSTSPALASRQEHELALLLSGRCRRCAERIPGGSALGGLPCARCGEQTLPSPVDRLVLQELQGSHAAVHLWVVVAAVGAASLAAGWFPVLSSLLLVGALVWIRFTIIRPALRLFTPRRRLVSRWTLRLAGGCFLSLAVVGLELLTLLPGVGALLKVGLSAAEVAVAGSFARGYLSWQTRRAARDLPIAAWEVGLLGVWLAALLVAVAGSVAAALWILDRLGWVQGLLGPL
jgi:hypothetical protein